MGASFADELHTNSGLTHSPKDSHEQPMSSWEVDETGTSHADKLITVPGLTNGANPGDNNNTWITVSSNRVHQNKATATNTKKTHILFYGDGEADDSDKEFLNTK
eukprot:5327616-Ditylum_brightwellii.AAC.1